MCWWITSLDYPLTKNKMEGVLHPLMTFADEHLLALAISSAPWYANLVNYLVSGITTLNMNSSKRSPNPSHIFGRSLACIRFVDMVL